MMVTNTPTRLADKKPTHPAAECLAQCCVYDHPILTWNNISEEIRGSLVNQANRVICALEVAGWKIVRREDA